MKVPGLLAIGSACLAFAVTVTVHAESITPLYEITFDAPIHTVGQPPALGCFEPTCRTIQDYGCHHYGPPQPPAVVTAFGELTNQPCLFSIDPNETEMIYQTIMLDMYDYLVRNPDLFPYTRYKLELDLLIESLAHEKDYLELDFDAGWIAFCGNGIIQHNSTILETGFTLGQKIHITVEIDDTAEEYTVYMNGAPVALGNYQYPIDEIKINWSDSFFSGNKAAIDNIFVYGIAYQPVLHVTHPKLGSGFTVGKTYPLTWYASSDMQKIVIDYSIDNGSTWTPVSPPRSGNADTYYWTVPDTPSNICKLRFSDDTAAVQVESKTFRICPPVPDLPSYEVIYLDELFGEHAFLPDHLNDHGDFSARNGFAWINNELICFQDKSIAALNNRKQVLMKGTSVETRELFYIWQNGIITNTVKMAENSWPRSTVIDINDRGRVVGYHTDDDTFSWTDKTGIRDLNRPASGDACIPSGINNLGQILLRSLSESEDVYIWEKGSYTTLDVPYSSAPLFINDLGTIAGLCSIGYPFVDSYIVLYKDGELINLGRGELVGINDNDMILALGAENLTDGCLSPTTAYHLIYGAERYNLTQLAKLHPDTDLFPSCLNNKGWIGGYLYTPEHTGRETGHPFLLVPKTERSLEKIMIFGPDRIYENSTVSFRAVGVCDDNCPMPLTREAAWSVYPPIVGTIDPNGFLKVTDLEGIHKVIVNVEYVGEETFQVSRTFPAHAARQLLVPTEYPTIQAAFDAAYDTDEIILEDGIYRGDGNRDIRIDGKQIVLKSRNGPESCIIDPESTQQDPHAGIIVTYSDKQVQIEGLTVTQATPGIRFEGSGTCYVKVMNCVIKNNNGHGIVEGSGTFDNCIIADNAGYGVYRGYGRIYNSTISGNQSGGCFDTGTTIVNSKVCGNNEYAFYDCDYGSIKNTVISGSTYGLIGCNLTLDNCMLAGNQYGIYNCSATAATNCIFYKNNHAIYSVFNPLPAMNHCLFYDNGRDIYQKREHPEDYTQVEYRYAEGAEEINALPEAEGTLDSNPLFEKNGLWAGSLWIDGDYHLRPGSPCIDAGTDIIPLYYYLDIDPDGVLIPQDGDLDEQVLTDIGVYEYVQHISPWIHTEENSLTWYGTRDQPRNETRTVVVENRGLEQLQWSIVSDTAWLDIAPASGIIGGLSSERIELAFDPQSLAPGLYQTEITIQGINAINSQTITANFIVGQTLHVPADFAAIQDALDNAADGDTILLADGTYTGDGNRDIDFLGKAVTVQSQNGPETCIIDCQGTQEDPHRAFIFQNSETNTSVLSGFTIINGYAKEITYLMDGLFVTGHLGGAIFSDNASPVISNCIIEKCEGSEGSGIFANAGSPVITDSTFRQNRGAGAAIRTDRSSTTITNCRFTANFSVDWGIVIIEGEPLTVRGPGAVFLTNGSGTVSHCSFTGNTGVYNAGLTFALAEGHLDHCIFVGNRGEVHASLDGICPESYQFYWPDTMIKASNCIFRQNHLDGDEPEIVNGVIMVMPSFNNMVAASAASAEEPVPIYEIHYSCFDFLDPGLPGFGNIQADPMFVDDGHWDGDTWMDGDYHLLSAGWRWDAAEGHWTWDEVTSPCIDAGHPGMPLGDEPVTLAVDPLNRWSENVRVNMGAYGRTPEASIAPPGWMLLCDLDNSLRVDLADLAEMTAAWQHAAPYQLADVTREGIVDLQDFAYMAGQWLQYAWRPWNIPIPDDDIPIPPDDPFDDEIPVPGG